MLARCDIGSLCFPVGRRPGIKLGVFLRVDQTWPRHACPGGRNPDLTQRLHAQRLRHQFGIPGYIAIRPNRGIERTTKKPPNFALFVGNGIFLFRQHFVGIELAIDAAFMSLGHEAVRRGLLPLVHRRVVMVKNRTSWRRHSLRC